MRFSKLITDLQKGSSGLEASELGTDPDLLSGASIEQALSNQICFLEAGNSLSKELNSTKAGAVIIPSQEDLIEIAQRRELAWATFKNPRLAFAEVLELLQPTPQNISGIHPSAVIHENVFLGDNISIGANVFIGNGSRIASKSVIYPGAVIYENVILGEACIVHANAVIHPRTKLGKKCVIHSNAVIGSEGFGFVPTPNGWRKMPQTGRVVLQDEVEIGCGSNIDRPAVGETFIGAGTKIDNLVQIGHGVTTGKDCAMAAQVGIAGGARLGNGVILAGQVGVGNRVKVGDRVVASSKCGIHSDVAPDQVVSGFPAIPNRLWLRCSIAFSKLPEMAKTIKELTKRETS